MTISHDNLCDALPFHHQCFHVFPCITNIQANFMFIFLSIDKCNDLFTRSPTFVREATILFTNSCVNLSARPTTICRPWGHMAWSWTLVLLLLSLFARPPIDYNPHEGHHIGHFVMEAWCSLEHQL